MTVFHLCFGCVMCPTDVVSSSIAKKHNFLFLCRVGFA
jgi:hypothetical protein